MGLLVREACLEDAAAIVAIMNPIIAAGTFTVFDTPFTIDAEKAFLEGFPARGVIHVAVDSSAADQRVLGFQSMEPFANYTHGFDHVGIMGTYVDLASRRQGIASALFDATFEAARRKGYEKIFTFVRADNPAALATYVKHGFAIVGTARRHAKINGAYIDETIIERFL
jgi:L-amino acid N-acyltransferase YncA